MADNRKRHVHWGFGHWDFDYLVSDSEGLSLLSGRYRGVPIFGKFMGRNPDDAFLEVEVDALDVNSGLIAKAYTSATIWVC